MNNTIIAFSGTHATGKTFIVEELCNIYNFKKITNIYRTTIKELGIENICTYRTHEYLICNFISNKYRCIKAYDNYIFDRSIIDPIIYGEIRGLNKNISINDIIIDMCRNLSLNNCRYIVISLLFGDIRRLYDIDNEFFNRVLCKDIDRKNSVFMGSIDNAIRFIEVFESVYNKYIDLFNNVFDINVFKLSDFIYSNSCSMFDILNRRNDNIKNILGEKI